MRFPSFSSLKRFGPKRAFSLMEALISLALAAVVLVLAGSMSQSMLNISRNTDSRDRLSGSVLRGLDMLVGECRAAQGFQSPLPSQTSPEVIFDRFEAAPSRLPSALPAVLPATFLPRDGMVRVHYALSAEGRLTRTVTSSEILIENVTQFSATLSGKTLTIQLDLNDRGRPYSFSRKVTPLCGR